MSSQEVPLIPEIIDFPAEELKILSLWGRLDAFQTCLQQSKTRPKYSFYDGPPFATGLPHYGHILAGTVKDVVTRYAHQRGFHVERRFGWDCHGLPVEYEVDKALGVKGYDDVQKMGIAAYNAECRKIVTRYVSEWKMTMNRIGRWIDFGNDYKTLYPWFMESIWWVFKQLYLKGLVYHGNKVMPYSTACHTPLSNFESGQNYKEVTDPAITVSLPIVGDEDGASLLIWTTTPWTLPSNLAVCVNESLTYARVQDTSTGKIYVLLSARASVIFKDFKILKEFPGKDLKDLKYEPIFSYFHHMKSKGAFRVLTDDYVTSESGTGIVHQAPYFGEDDFRVCLSAGIVTPEQDPICPMDPDGRLTHPISDFEGQYFQDANKNIIAALKAKNRLVQHSQVTHRYPFCWRSDTALVYRAVPSWFIRVQHLSDGLQQANSETYWVPDFVQEKRFTNWLKEARDWAVSRNRSWGTPIPIWMSPDGSEVCCVGSIAELEKLTGVQVKDLHRENIDDLLIPSRTPGNPPLHRIPEVFDCWFESGCMPYAQKHFPFENRKEFYECFPADFIAEGIDQTRGWFYTLLVISHAMFGKAPFKNLIASGLVLASDGQKMSKRKKNYPDPLEVVRKYGADSLRLYLINSPVVRAENLKFKEEGVRDIIKDVLLPWFNAFRFLLQNVKMYVEGGGEFYFDESVRSANIMDRWILSLTQSLLEHVHKEMAKYRLYNVVPKLLRFFEHLTNWYVRMNRKRLKGEEDSANSDHYRALMTLFNVLLTITKVMAPFAPFFSEYIYQNLKIFTNFNEKSIHFLMLPNPVHSLIDNKIEVAVHHLQEVIELARLLRDKKNLPMKYPLPELVVIHYNSNYLSDVQSLEPYIISEINVRQLTLCTDRQSFNIKMKAKPDYKTLGQTFKSNYKDIAQTIESLQEPQISQLLSNGSLAIREHHIDASLVRLCFECGVSKKYAMETHEGLMVLLDVNPTQDMLEEGYAREVINRIQKLRKEAHLTPSDKINVYYRATNNLKTVTATYSDFIKHSIRTNFIPMQEWVPDLVIAEDCKQFKGSSLRIVLAKERTLQIPAVKWVNVLLEGFSKKSKGLILLEIGNETLSLEGLKNNIQTLFNVSNFIILSDKGELKAKIGELSAQTLLVLPREENGANLNRRNSLLNRLKDYSDRYGGIPFCEVLNFDRDGIVGTVVLENPAGIPTFPKHDYSAVIDEWVSKFCKM